MSELAQPLAEAADRLFSQRCDSRLVASADAGQWPQALWSAVDELGPGQLLAPESAGGENSTLNPVSLVQPSGTTIDARYSPSSSRSALTTWNAMPLPAGSAALAASAVMSGYCAGSTPSASVVVVMPSPAPRNIAPRSIWASAPSMPHWSSA